MNLSQLSDNLQSAEKMIQFCQEKNLIGKIKSCRACKHPCNLKKMRKSYAWRCQNTKCRTWTALREGTFFSRSKLGIDQILKFLYLWSHEMASVKNIRRECGINSAHTLTEWKNLMRDICAEYFLRNPQQIGGPGHTVKVGESLFNKRKHNVGKALQPLWIFGGYDPAEKESFLVTVSNKNAETLLPLIKKYILPGTTVVSDCWRAYSGIGGEGYEHKTVNHKLHFIDPTTKATTNHVERMWKEVKQRNKIECETNRALIDSYLAEFMWRQKFKKDPFTSLLKQIAEYYP